MFDDFEFGLLQPLIDDPSITDINYNGIQCWVDHLKKGRYPVEPFEGHSFMQSLAYKIANYVNLPFNATSPVLEAETRDIRISMVHQSVARGGLSISLRKTPGFCRLHDKATGIHTYAPPWVIEFLKHCVQGRTNVVVSGLPGSGKTELIKYLMESIPAGERVITIEDTLELRYGDIFPTKDHVMFKVQEHFDYERAIKTSLRQRPDWICISEVRGAEIIHLLQSVSTGTSLLSTIHAESAFAIPFRMMVMMPGSQLTNQSLNTLIHDTVDFGIHLEVVSSSSGISRRIREVVHFRIDAEYRPIKQTVYSIQEPQKSVKFNEIIQAKRI